MSSLVTVDEVYDEAKNVLPSSCVQDPENFMTLLNRAVKRLSYKHGAPGLIVEVDVTADSDGIVWVNTELYHHVLSFKHGEKPIHIAPVVDTYLDEGVSSDRFIDLGYDINDEVNRKYSVPRTLCGGTTEFKMLARRKYEHACSGCDVIPVNSSAAVVMAMTAIFYEDRGDYATADAYWVRAMNELEDSSRDFRGPVTPTLQLLDPVEFTSNTTFM